VSIEIDFPKPQVSEMSSEDEMPYATMDEQTDDAEPKRRTIVRQTVLRQFIFHGIYKHLNSKRYISGKQSLPRTQRAMLSKEYRSIN
jgi:hypothetical protein